MLKMSQGSKADRFTLDIWIPAGCLYTPGFVGRPTWPDKILDPQKSEYLQISGNLPYYEIANKYNIDVNSIEYEGLEKPEEFDLFDILPYAKELAQDSILYIFSKFSQSNLPVPSQNVMTDRLFFRNIGSLDYHMAMSEFAENYTLAFVHKTLLKEEYNDIKINNNTYEPNLANLILSYTEEDKSSENYEFSKDPTKLHIQMEIFRIYPEDKFVLLGRIYDGSLWEFYDVNIYHESEIYDETQTVSKIQHQLSYMARDYLLSFDFLNDGPKYTIREP